MSLEIVSTLYVFRLRAAASYHNHDLNVVIRYVQNVLHL